MTTILLAALSATLVAADQPVSCLRTNFKEAVWNFHVTKESGTVNLFEVQELCTHELPNRFQILEHGHQFAFAEEDIWQLVIKPDYTASAKFCPGGDTTKCSSDEVQGTWNAYYDQALQVDLKNNLKFFANFKYELKANITNDLQHANAAYLETVLTDDETQRDQFSSVCNATMVGFVYNTSSQGSLAQHPVTCFFADKQEKESAQLAEPPTTQQQMSLAQGPVQKLALRDRRKNINLHEAHVPNKQSDDRIMHINENQHMYAWTANTCMLSKDHPSYACNIDNTELVEIDDHYKPKALAEEKDFEIVHEEWPEEKPSQEKKNLAQKAKLERMVKKYAAPMKKNAKSGKPAGDINDPTYMSALSDARQWASKYKKNEDIPDSAIPKTWDFRNISGFDFTGKLRDQGPCGSCYTMGFIQQVDARLQLKYGHLGKQPDMSPQFLMQCNYLNEGCEGGWAAFHGTFAENGHMVKEECAPYAAMTKGAGLQCPQYQHCEPYAKVSKSYYVGEGYNFMPQIEQIQKEMLMNGPLTAEIKCGDDFGYYESGIFVQTVKETEDLPGSNPAEHVEAQGYVKPIDAAQKSSKAQSAVQVGTGSEAFIASQMADQPLDHTVFLVGWDVDEKTQMPVWIVRNSYGDTWGMNGDFLVRRGYDDWGFESELSGYEIELIQH